MKILQEFRDFAVKGSVIDLAVGVIIGAAFGKITSSLVEDVIMPPLGLVVSKVDFTKLKIILKPEVLGGTNGSTVVSPAVAINYGQFLNVVFQFLIIAFVVFMMVKAINKAKAKPEEPSPSSEPVVKRCPFCLSDIPYHAVKCKFCGSEIPSLAPDPMQAS